MTSILPGVFLSGGVGVVQTTTIHPHLMSNACLQAHSSFEAASATSTGAAWAIDLCDPTHAMNISWAQASIVCNDTNLYWEDDTSSYQSVPFGLQMLSNYCLPCTQSVYAWTAATGVDWEFNYTQFCDPSDPVNTTAQSLLATCGPDDFLDDAGDGFVESLQISALGCNPCWLAFTYMSHECDQAYPGGSPTLHICLNTTMCYQKIVAAEIQCASTNFVTDTGFDAYASVQAIKQTADMVLMNPSEYCSACNLAYLYMQASPSPCDHMYAYCDPCNAIVQAVLDACTGMNPPQSYMNTGQMPSDLRSFQHFVDGCNGVGQGHCIQIPAATAQAFNAVPCS